MTKKVCLALQGGGSHGAFTWGVVDRLLEEDIYVEGVSGTSAGAMNGTAIVEGSLKGGNPEAKKLMRLFWEAVGEEGRLSPFQPTVGDAIVGNEKLDNNPVYQIFRQVSHTVSPYQSNPFNYNPLEDIVNKVFTFNEVADQFERKLFLCATHVKEGKLKIFKNHELSAKALLASACLPMLHQAVKVNGEYYWDGGFVGNPAIFPLIYECESTDIIVIQLNSAYRGDLPVDALSIGDRLNEITNNLSLMREMRQIKFITDLIDTGAIPKENLKRVNMHLIRDDETFQPLGFSSKLNATPEFLEHLHAAGRRAAERWLEKHWEGVGKTSTADHSLYEEYK